MFFSTLLILNIKNQAEFLPSYAKRWEMVKKYAEMNGSWRNSLSTKTGYI